MINIIMILAQVPTDEIIKHASELDPYSTKVYGFLVLLLLLMVIALSMVLKSVYSKFISILEKNIEAIQSFSLTFSKEAQEEQQERLVFKIKDAVREELKTAVADVRSKLG